MEAPHGSYAWTTAPAARLVLGLLHALPSPLSTPCADGRCTADHSLGSRHFQRDAAPVRSLHRMRSQGRDVAKSWLEEWRSGVGAVPSRRDEDTVTTREAI
jgi:hypothetical protein